MSIGGGGGLGGLGLGAAPPGVSIRAPRQLSAGSGVAPGPPQSASAIRRGLSAQSPSFSVGPSDAAAGAGPGVFARSLSAGPPASESKSSGITGLIGGGKASSSKLNVRLNQPVEHCPLEMYALARDDTGTIIPKNDPRLTYKWFMSAGHSVCAHSKCPRIAGDTSVRSKMQCIDCLQRGVPPGLTFFCSAKCFAAAWPLHKRYHGDSVTGGTPEDDAAFLPPSVPSSGPAAGAGAGAAAAGAAATPSSSPSSTSSSSAVVPVVKPTPGVDWHDLEYVGAFRDAPGPCTGDSEWVEIGAGRSFLPSRVHVWHKLQLQLTAATSASGPPLVQLARTKWVLPLPPPAPRRPFLPCTTVPLAGSPPLQTYADPAVHHVKGGLHQPHALRLMSFNVLAEIYATQTIYPYCPLWALRWTFRQKRLVAELRRYNPDIVCLQEVQADHFAADLYPAMAELGYEGLYKQKTREPMGAEGKVDGCALFFRRSRFSLLEKYVIEFNEAAMAESQKMKNAQPPAARKQQLNVALHRLLRDNVAQVVLLEMRTDPAGAPLPTPAVLCVANTHLFWDPEYADVKLWQTHMLVKELEKFVLQRDLPLVLCGDFNSAPGSAVHKLLSGNSTGRRSGLAREDLPADPCSILPGRGKLSHHLFLSSAYAVATGSEPKFTNFTGDFVGCLDYIFFTSDCMRVTASLELPGEAALTGFSRSPLPNPQYPSDHLPLCFDMVLGQPQFQLPEPPPPPPSQRHQPAPPLPSSPPPMMHTVGSSAATPSHVHQAASQAAPGGYPTRGYTEGSQDSSGTTWYS